MIVIHPDNLDRNTSYDLFCNKIIYINILFTICDYDCSEKMISFIEFIAELNNDDSSIINTSVMIIDYEDIQFERKDDENNLSMDKFIENILLSSFLKYLLNCKWNSNIKKTF